MSNDVKETRPRQLLVLVRGGGSVASGIVFRLWRCGYQVVVNEITIPKMIRREASYGNAVHRGEMVLERVRAKHVPLKEVPSVLAEGKIIPVVTDPYEVVLTHLKPVVIVDALMDRMEVNTAFTDAPLTIACGPGYVAGKDVHVVIESMRGYRLGRCIYDGEMTIQSSKIPERSRTTNRIYAPQGGLFIGKRHIGEMVKVGDIVAYVDDTPIKAHQNGIVRGMLCSKLMVQPKDALVDIDGTCEEKDCFSISDRALSIGGGVIEAVMAWEFEHRGKGYESS